MSVEVEYQAPLNNPERVEGQALYGLPSLQAAIISFLGNNRWSRRCAASRRCLNMLRFFLRTMGKSWDSLSHNWSRKRVKALQLFLNRLIEVLPREAGVQAYNFLGRRTVGQGRFFK